ncbi:MAG: NTP transferase domain-containing protein [Erysipelotrichaceae bacterium]|nr:NTP transferase domain-containing protein [Erysipelotrichaceae bacterium]
MKTIALIMAGGKGERFYPASRNLLPKQFLSLGADNETMIQKTVNRIRDLVYPQDIFVLTNKNYLSLVKEQLKDVPTENIVLEPLSKNTAPAIELGVEIAKRKYDDAKVIVLPSDHIIKDEVEFRRILKMATQFVENKESILTIGIKPTEPNDGYGYIKISDSQEISKVAEFKEKPTIEVAKQYVESGNYLWNAGMFIFTIKSIDNAFKKYMSNQHKLLTESLDNFPKVESISIDYGIMEKADNVYCIKGDFAWDDVGSWNALKRINGEDENQNTILNDKTVLVNSTNVTIKGTNKKLITGVGLKDIVIVETDDVILVANKNELSDIKKLTAKIKEKQLDEYL